MSGANSPITRAYPTLPDVTLYPSGGNDLARIVSAAATGARVILGAGKGPFRATTASQLPSGAWIEGENPTVTIIGSLPYVDGASSSVLAAFAVQGAAQALLSNVTVGASIFTLDAVPLGLVAGAMCFLGNGNGLQQYTVVSVAGSGSPYTVTVERPIMIPFTSAADTCQVVSSPTGIVVRNLTIVCVSGDRAIEINFARFCRLENIEIVSVGAGAHYTLADGTVVAGISGLRGFCWSLDVGSYQSRATRVICYGGGTAIMGGALESNEGSVVEDCYAYSTALGGLYAGIFAYMCIGCEIRGGGGSGNQRGLQLDTNGARTSVGCRVIGGAYIANVTGAALTDFCGWRGVGVETSNNTGAGVVIGTDTGSDVSVGVEWLEFRSNNNGSYGVQIITGDRLKLSGSANGNANDGVNIAAAVTRAEILSLTGDANAGFTLNTLADVNVGALSGWENTVNGVGSVGGGIITTQGSANVSIASLAGGASYNGNSWWGIYVEGTGTVRIGAGRIVMSGTGTKVGANVASGVLVITNTEIKQTAGTNFGLASNGGLIRKGDNVDVSTCTTPLSTSTGQLNSGTVALNGATPVTFAFADIKANDKVRTYMSTLGGTSAPYQVAINVGVGVVLTGRALDTSTITVEIQ